MRREIQLDEEEEAYLTAKTPDWETIKSDGNNWLLLHNFSIPEGYTVNSATAAVMIPREYPMAGLDMVYFYPVLELQNGRKIGATDARMDIEGVSYQRWSRHYRLKWDPERDSLITHVMAIEEWLRKEVAK